MIVAAIGFIALIAIGQPEPPERDTHVTKAAVADACRRVAERVLDLPLASGQPVRSALDDIAAEMRLREWLFEQTIVDFVATDDRGDVLAGVSLHIDDVAALPDQLREGLAGWHFREIGMWSSSSLQGASHPPGWENVTSDGVALARDAASYDLTRRTYDEIVARLSTQSPQQSPLWMDSRVRIRFASRLVIDAAAQAEFLPIQVCRVTANLSGRHIVDALRAAMAETSDLPVDDSWVKQVNNAIGDGGLEMTGYATPPLVETRVGFAHGGDTDSPAWSRTLIRVTGRGAVDSTLQDPAEAIAAAVRAAHTDARIKLAEQVDKLALPGPQSATVRQYVRDHPDQAAWWSAFLRSGRYGPPRCADGVCQVELVSDPSWLWAQVATGLDDWTAHRAASTRHSRTGAPADQSLDE